MLPVSSIKVLVFSRPIFHNLIMMMSYIPYNGLKCRIVSQFIKTDSGNLKEMFGFDIPILETYTRSFLYKRYHK
jgi:hypothetical protein